MTPVQLPEVPAPSAWAMTDYQPEANTQFTMRVDAAEHYASVGLQVEPLYTADQLRAYATEAVMAERAALSRLADRWRRAADWLESSPMAVTQSGDLQVRTYRNLADELDATTQPEQNSGR